MWAFYFPGQGSQSQGMGRWLYDQFREAQLVFEEASDALKFNAKKLCFDYSEEDLQKTENAQPAILITSIAYDRVLKSILDIKPLLAVGHSIGEYGALVSAGVMDFDRAVYAVRERGLAMQSAVPLGQGGMFAVLGLEDTEVLEFCAWVRTQNVSGVIEAANFNAPGQVVISGDLNKLEWGQKNWSLYEGKGAGKKAKFIPLKVSAPFHCSLMKPAEEKMASVLESIPFKTPQWSIIQNFTATETTDPKLIKENLIKQISGPVRWTESVQNSINLGVRWGLELGHGQVVKGLNKKISVDLEMVQIQNLEDLKKLELKLKEISNV